MSVVPIRIPQLGEGLQEARLVEFLKQPGDTVSRDECIYVMETDKAVTEVESPHGGKVAEWTVEADSVLPIGAVIGSMEVAEAVEDAFIDHSTSPTGVSPEGGALLNELATALPKRVSSRVAIPPRTKRYLKEKGLLEVVDQISAAGTKLMPKDVDRFIAQQSFTGVPHVEAPSDVFDETSLPRAQQTLIYRMARGAQLALPAVLETELDWENIAAGREQTRQANGPTGFAMFLWCVVQAMCKHPILRSTLSSDSKVLRTYHHVNLGVAVSRPGDELKTAVVRQADLMDQATFFCDLTCRIDHARAGSDQVNASTTVTVSNIGAEGMRTGIPIIVTPAVATMALGAICDKPVPTADGFTFRKTALLTMSFDHRFLNGIGASNFLNDVRECVATFKLAAVG